MTQTASFDGRLFGPGIAGAGVAAGGQWQDDLLVLRGGDIRLEIPAADLRIDAAGFNVQQIRLSWRSERGEFAFFIEQAGDCERFLAQAPEPVTAQAGGIRKRQRGVASRFHAAVLVYGFILALPLILLALFLLNTDRLAGWVAQKVPVAYEAKIGNMVLAQTRTHTRLIESGPAHDAVKRIGAKLTAGSRYSYQWFVAEGKEVNAFAAPGGVIVVYAGLIAQAERAEELAGVLAHEVEHVEQRHSLRNLIKSAGFGVALSLALGDWSGSALGGWIANLTELKFSRDAEMEADREGLHRMVRANIEPEYMARFFAKLAQEEGKAAEALSMLATHPASRERMEALHRQITALPPKEYEALDIDWAKVKAAVVSSSS